MDYLKSATLASLLLLATPVPLSYASAALQQAKAQLSSYESSLKQIGSKVQTIDVRIKSYQGKIADAKSDIASAKQDLDTARSELIQAKHDKSEDAERKEELAQKKYDISQLGYENRQKRLERLERKLSKLQDEKQNLLARSESTQLDIREQASKVIQLSTAQARSTPASPQLATEKSAVSPPVLTSAPPKVAPPIAFSEDLDTEMKAGKKKVGETVQTAKLAGTRGSDAMNEPGASDAEADTATGSRLQRDYAAQQMAALSRKIKEAGDGDEWKLFKDLELKVGRRSSEEFEYLGGHQYYIETDLEEGDERVKIGRKYYKLNLPSAGTYVIIYDTEDKNSPTFSMFKKSWVE